MMKNELNRNINILPAQDALSLLRHQRTRQHNHLPVYNRGVGGVRSDYANWLQELVGLAARHADHIFVWRFPNCLSRLDRLQRGFLSWLGSLWYYKNCPSVIRGWRSAQSTCLHLISARGKNVS